MQLSVFAFLFMILVACDSKPTNAPQTVVGQGAGADNVIGQDIDDQNDDELVGSDDDSGDDAGDGDNNNNDGDDNQGGDAITTFAQFDEEAAAACGSCHFDGSGRAYLVGDEANAATNAATIISRINLSAGEAGVMPQSGPPSADTIARWEAYLNTLN